jgi:hypothetical protein
MSTNCKHGLDARWCSICIKAAEKEDLRADALRLMDGGTPVIVLRGIQNGRRIKVLQLNTSCPIIEIDPNRVQAKDNLTAGAPEYQRYLEQFGALARKRGFLFQSKGPLTYREQTEEGPTHCHVCKALLSFEGG